MLRLVTAPTESPVSLDDLKMVVEAADFTDDDAKLELFLSGAVSSVAKETNLVLAPCAYRVERECWWSNKLEVLVSPVRDIVSVNYFDASGALQTLPTSAYRWLRKESFSTIELIDMGALQNVAVRDDAIQIELEAGFDIDGATGSGDDPELILPREARNAIIMLAAHWYKNREATGGEMKEIPFGVKWLMQKIMVYR